MTNFYVDFLHRMIALAENPSRLLKESPDKGDVQLVFAAVAFFLLLLVLWLIIATDAKINAPLPEIPEEDESNNVDYRRMLEEANSNEILTGSTDRYTWQQTETEMDVFLPLTDSSVKSKEIKVTFNSKSVTVTIRGEVDLEGDLYADIIPSECNWQIEASEGEESGRILWITIVKRAKTSRSTHWTCFLRSDATVTRTNAKGGPPAIAIDTSDKEGMKEAMANLRQRIKDKSVR